VRARRSVLLDAEILLKAEIDAVQVALAGHADDGVGMLVIAVQPDADPSECQRLLRKYRAADHASMMTADARKTWRF
jgi:hypothetical protein